MTRPEEFATSLRRLLRGVGRLERDVVCCDVTLQQFDTLRLLVAGSRSNTELAQALGIDLSTASRNLSKLEAAGYIDRVPVAGDARAWANQLSRKGRGCVDGMLEEERDVLGAILQRIPYTRREAARALVLELADAVEAELDARSDGTCCAPTSPSSGACRRA